MKRNKNQESEFDATRRSHGVFFYFTDPWMNLDQGKLQQEGAREKIFSEEGQGEPEQN